MGKRMAWRLASVLAAVMLAGLAGGCGGSQPAPTPSPTASSGIEGRTMVKGGGIIFADGTGPGRLRPMKGAGVAILHAGDRSVAARAKSDGRGRFRVALSPGTYIVRLAGWGSSASHVKVTVEPGSYPHASVTAYPY